ncbi:hypothetical protein CE91St32_05740 [Gordonibacter pamelaeae]|jgi:hypothetical protein|nr:hypothetical protein CE91St32_05740 [Gordonibacter pamelaeae]
MAIVRAEAPGCTVFTRLLQKEEFEGRFVCLDGIAVPFIGGVFPDRDKADDAKAPASAPSMQKTGKNCAEKSVGARI